MFKIENISKSYGKKRILNNISFSVNPGECIGLLGVNGSGKSTLLNILASGIKADNGSYSFDQPHKKVSFLPQENPLIEELSGWDNIRLWYDGKSKDIADICNSDIITGLGVNTFLYDKVKTMSGGMKKRLSLAIAMMNRPDLLLLDEPLAALDLLCKNGILQYISRYITSGGSVIIATHEESALSICSSIYILKNGELIPAQDKNIERLTKCLSDY
jgi:ABC-type multidrug transport system ATPase subunit